MDVMVSTGWRSAEVSVTVNQAADQVVTLTNKSKDDLFISKHGRYEIVLCEDNGGWIVQYTSAGRLFGPRELIYSERHTEVRYAAWDVMCRVIRATDDEELGVNVGRKAMNWLLSRAPIC